MSQDRVTDREANEAQQGMDPLATGQPIDRIVDGARVTDNLHLTYHAWSEDKNILVIETSEIRDEAMSSWLTGPKLLHKWLSSHSVRSKRHERGGR